MPLHLHRPSPSRVLLAGAIASSAYALEMAVDIRLTANPYDDFVILGGAVTRYPRRRRPLGILLHYALGTGLAAVYQSLQPSPPRMPGWARGLIFIGIEHALSFPTLVLFGSHHPMARSGDLPALATWRYFWVETARHAAYGAALGIASE